MSAPRPLSLPERQTTPWITVTADLLLAVAIVSLFPAATPFLPLAPIFVLLPRWTDRLRSAGPRRGLLQYVPDPDTPSWRQLALMIGDACRQVAADGVTRRLRLATFCRSDGTPHPYTIDFRPRRRTLTVQEDDNARVHEHHLRLLPRPRLPLPLTIRDQPVELCLARQDAAGEPGILIARTPSPHPAQGLAALLLVPPALLLVERRLALVAAVALLTPMISRLASGTIGRQHLLWWRGSIPAADPPAISLRFDLIRLWFAAILIQRMALIGTPWEWLWRDPIRLVCWGLVVPPLFLEAIVRLRSALYPKS